MNINESIIEQLKIVARDVTYEKAKLAAAIVYKNKIVSIGMNSYNTHGFQYRYGKNSQSICWHAENHAIYNAKQNYFDKWKKSTLYVVRIKWNGTDKEKIIIGNSKPCSGCMRAIRDHNIKNIVYTLDSSENEDQNYGIIVL